MANRSASVLLQIGTVAALTGAWLWARAARNPKHGTNNASPYSIRPKPYAALSVLLLWADIYATPAILRGKGIIDVKELADINADTVGRFDRHALSFLGSRHKHYQRISDNVLKALVALPFLLLFDK